MTQKLLKAVKGARASDASWNRFFAFCLALAYCNIWIHSTCCRYARVMYRGSGLSPLSHLPGKSLWRKMWFLHCPWKWTQHDLEKTYQNTDLSDTGWHRLCHKDSLNPQNFVALVQIQRLTSNPLWASRAAGKKKWCFKGKTMDRTGLLNLFWLDIYVADYIHIKEWCNFIEHFHLNYQRWLDFL